MKILFLIALLANITFFFWHLNTTSVDGLPVKAADINEDKQILLVGELSKKEKRKNQKYLD